jgi:hypothetical protein
MALVRACLCACVLGWLTPQEKATSRLNRSAASLSDYSNSSVGDEVIVSHGRYRRRVAYPRRSQPR